MVQANRILIVVHSLAGGGAERVAADLSRYLLHRSRHVTLLTLTGDQPDDYRVPADIRRERIDMRLVAPSRFGRACLAFARHLDMRRKILALDPDVVVSFVDQTNVRTILCLLGNRVPVIVAERVHPGHNPISSFWQIARRVTYPLASAVTVQTDDGAHWFRRFTHVRGAVVIPNATRFDGDVQAQAGANALSVSRPLVLGMGRLTAQKGFDILLKAFSRSGLAELGWHLAILGEGPEREVLEGQVSSLGLTASVTLPGNIRDVGSWLRSADMFVLSSRFEGFPNALLEAMQVGVPSISFDCQSGPRELIQHGVNGCLVRPDDADALADQMRLLGLDPDLRARLGGEATKVNETFSPERIYSRWLDLIDIVATGEFDARQENALSSNGHEDDVKSRLRGQRGVGS